MAECKRFRTIQSCRSEHRQFGRPSLVQKLRKASVPVDHAVTKLHSNTFCSRKPSLLNFQAKQVRFYRSRLFTVHMSGYDVEHDIQDAHPEQPRRRPDLSTFFSTLQLVDTSGSHEPHNPHALPLPRDISAAFRNLANAFEMMRGGTSTSHEQNHNELLQQLVESLMASAENPPEKVDGVSDEFIGQLERIPKKTLNSDQICPICGNAFLEGLPLPIKSAP